MPVRILAECRECRAEGRDEVPWPGREIWASSSKRPEMAFRLSTGREALSAEAEGRRFWSSILWSVVSRDELVASSKSSADDWVFLRVVCTCSGTMPIILLDLPLWIHQLAADDRTPNGDLNLGAE